MTTAGMLLQGSQFLLWSPDYKRAYPAVVVKRDNDRIFYKWKNYGDQGESPPSCSRGFRKHSPDMTEIVGAFVDVNNANIDKLEKQIDKTNR